MKNKKLIKAAALALAVVGCAFFALTGLTASAETNLDSTSSATRRTGETVSADTAAVSSGGALVEADELFTERDLTQTPDLTGAVTLTVRDGEDILIDSEGVYILRGTAKNATVTVDADGAKVQLVLDGLSITNDDFPCLYVKNADKVFVTTVADSSLTVTGSFRADGDTNTDAVIFSRDDLVLNGSAALTLSSSKNGVSVKDDLKITGGSYIVTAGSKCFEANDSIRIAGGEFTLTAGTDGLHAENADDDSLGWIYIADGSFSIDAGDDAIHALSFVQIDGGSFSIRAAEGIEATYVLINGGEIDIESWDDGINAARKSGAFQVCVEINGGDISIAMSQGDTDGVDSNGNIIINGGTISVTGNSTFDYDGSAVYNGGTVIVNGQAVTTIPNQMMGGPGGMGGDPGGMGGGPGGMGGGFPGGGRH